MCGGIQPMVCRSNSPTWLDAPTGTDTYPLAGSVGRPCRLRPYSALLSYFVVAPFHYAVFGTVVFAMFSGFSFWWPKSTGKMLDERLGKIHFWTLFVGFHTTFLVQHWLGAEGMPCRFADYLAADGFTALNSVSTIGAFLLGLSTLPFLYKVWKTAKYGRAVKVDDPWGHGRSLEWATSCPPPRHNFLTLPKIRSESPAFDLHHPDVAALDQAENPGRYADARRGSAPHARTAWPKVPRTQAEAWRRADGQPTGRRHHHATAGW
jgi:heme/copper-type cytochrome/quinol oxidase subunit 1